jgi:hypothetical protein
MYPPPHMTHVSSSSSVTSSTFVFRMQEEASAGNHFLAQQESYRDAVCSNMTVCERKREDRVGG